MTNPDLFFKGVTFSIHWGGFDKHNFISDIFLMGSHVMYCNEDLD